MTARGQHGATVAARQVATPPTRSARSRLDLAAVLAGLAGLVLIAAVYTVWPHSHTVYRTPAACTKAALLAEQNQLDWLRRDQAHVDAENAVLDGVTRHQFLQILAGNIPARPHTVDLKVCAR